MKHNLNENEKRTRKRIVVKRDSLIKKNEKPIVKAPNNLDQNEKTLETSTTYFSNTNEINKVNEWKNDRNTRDGHKNTSNYSNQKRSFNPNFKKAFTEDPSMGHVFFKKHENKEVPQPTLAKNNIKENELLRLNKFISNAGICSRREADELITKGVIKVNGNIITELGHKINQKDIVEYKGKRVIEANHVYILLNKPKDTITTTSDPENRPTVMDLVQKATDQRIFPIGRLDRNTTGVIILTNDGDFAQKLAHPSSEVKKVYYAILDKPLEKEHFEKLMDGVILEDGPMNVDEIAYVDPKDHTLIGVEIHSGKNRVVHRMFEHLGYKLKKLDRVVYAGLDKGGLRRGKWRFLKFNEIQMVLNTIKYEDF